jgi:hypothetical protein
MISCSNRPVVRLNLRNGFVVKILGALRHRRRKSKEELVGYGKGSKSGVLYRGQHFVKVNLFSRMPLIRLCSLRNEDVLDRICMVLYQSALGSYEIEG